MNLLRKIFIAICISTFTFLFIPTVVEPLETSISVQAASIKINTKKKTLNVKETYTLKITGTNKKVKWSSNKKSVATVNSKGKVTAKKAGTATITAKVGNKSYKCTIKVEAPKLNKTSKTLHINDKYTLKLSKTSQKVTWTSSNKKVATVNSKGVVTAKKAGTATISAKVGSTKYSCKVTVKYYGPGTYKAGSTIPAGTYCLFTTSDLIGTYSIRKNKSTDSESIIETDFLSYNFIISIKKGQYLDLDYCYAVPISKAKIKTNGEGHFRVGTDISAGKYKLKMLSSYGFYALYSKSGSSLDNMISCDFWEKGTKTITVKKGQYLHLDNCKLIKQ